MNHNTYPQYIQGFTQLELEIFRFFYDVLGIVRASYLIQQTNKRQDVLRVADAAQIYGLDKSQTIG